MSSMVSRPAVAGVGQAITHFSSLALFETDCWDLHHGMSNQRQDFVLLNMREQAAYQQGHLPQAVLIQHSRIDSESLALYPADTLFVVYCADPHCNGADKAALKLAQLNRPVKKMLGGVTGWLDEGFSLWCQSDHQYKR
ncbi:rhodanese-like domain-containing protein [Rheinheimera sediminis]|uniref:rhodanese-like domain-containing protein n=1 Tax=Rheinheimera sp. YQF-1 TaxID=2499626 RepID=UPI000FD7B967|nr:rhodanese-like domain-containing protein [Rheinheimera sp. YQF-1]RVT45692.1 rhodanese-like domain-containing protein [Rheinheimera sp. YQF-1]